MSKKDFSIIKSIGSGSYSTVQKVKRNSDDKIQAMKEIKINTLQKADKEGCLNEIRLLASISSAYIVKQLDAFYDEQSRNLCIITEFADDGDLTARINGCKKANTMLPEDEIWKYITHILKGLRDLHKMKVFHRDIKSANIFLYKGCLAKIGDLNVSKLQKNGLAKTQTGTPYQCPPEIWADKPYDSKCDIWSLGIVLQEMCALKPPFDAKDMKSLQDKIKTGRQNPISNKQSKELHNLLSKMLVVNPANRPTAEDMIKQHVPNRDLNKTMAKSNSNPDLLKTIKLPNNLGQLKNLLPQRRYQDDKEVKEKENQQVQQSMATNYNKPVTALNNPNPNVNIQGRPDPSKVTKAPSIQKSPSQMVNPVQNNARQVLGERPTPSQVSRADPRPQQGGQGMARPQSPNFGGNQAYARPVSNAQPTRPDANAQQRNANAQQPNQPRNMYEPRAQPTRAVAVPQQPTRAVVGGANANYRPNRLW